MFLADPLDVPDELVGYLAEQLGIEDPSCVKRYTEREKTKLEHSWEIQREHGLVAFAEVQTELVAWVADQAWMTGDGPKAIFVGAIEWLRSRNALLPGITTLDALIAEGRTAAEKRLWAQVAAHDVTRMISRDGQPTALGQAIAHYGRIYKTLHILRLADDEPYRREGKRQANLTEGRHDLARNVYHGKKGEVHQAYYQGMEDQLNSLGLVLNCVVLWNTVYLDHAVTMLREQGYPVLDDDVARLSAFIRAHLGLDGHYSFVLPDLGGRPRPLRDPDAVGDQ